MLAVTYIVPGLVTHHLGPAAVLDSQSTRLLELVK